MWRKAWILAYLSNYANTGPLAQKPLSCPRPRHLPNRPPLRWSRPNGKHPAPPKMQVIPWNPGIAFGISPKSSWGTVPGGRKSMNWTRIKSKILIWSILTNLWPCLPERGDPFGRWNPDPAWFFYPVSRCWGRGQIDLWTEKNPRKADLHSCKRCRLEFSGRWSGKTDRGRNPHVLWVCVHQIQGQG